MPAGRGEKPGFLEVRELLQDRLAQRFIENRFTDQSVKLGLERDEAARLFRRLVEEGEVLRDPKGYWQWV